MNQEIERKIAEIRLPSRNRLLGWGLAVIAVGVAWLIARGDTSGGFYSSDQVEKRLSKEMRWDWGVGGASAWIAREGVPAHTHELAGGRQVCRHDGKSFAELAGLDEAGLGCVVWGWFRAAGGSWHAPARVLVCFFFDKRGKLVGKLVLPTEGAT